MRKLSGTWELLACMWAAPAWSDEGMWTLNQFPAAAVKAKYGFEPTQAWLDHVRLASVRIAGGCSASVVSPRQLRVPAVQPGRVFPAHLRRLATARADELRF